jgi:hypothetical protein
MDFISVCEDGQNRCISHDGHRLCALRNIRNRKAARQQIAKTQWTKGRPGEKLFSMNSTLITKSGKRSEFRSRLRAPAVGFPRGCFKTDDLIRLGTREATPVGN